MKMILEPEALTSTIPIIASKFVSRVQHLFQTRCKRILIVEDEPELQSLYADFLTGRGYQVTVAGDLEQSGAFLKNEHFDVVLLDVVLPDGNGIDAIPGMKSQDPKLPIIVLTALGYDEETLQAAIRNGASCYISKILPLDQVLMEIHRVLNYAK